MNGHGRGSRGMVGGGMVGGGMAGGGMVGGGMVGLADGKMVGRTVGVVAGGLLCRDCRWSLR